MIEIEQKRKLPTGWKWVKLGEVCEFTNGLWKGKAGQLLLVKVLRNTNFTKTGLLDYSDIAEIEVQLNQFEKRQLSYGDIILERSGGGPTQAVGRVAFFDKKEENYSFSNFTTRIRVEDKERLDTIFLWYNLHNFHISGITEKLQRRTHGIRNLEFKKYISISIPLPPLSEQKRIAGILTRQMAAAAKAKEACQEKLEAAEKLPASYLNAIFNSDKAKQWPKKKLGKVCEINPRRPSDLKAKPQQKTTFVPMPAIDAKRGIINKSEVRPFEEIHKGYTYFEENDVLFAKITPCMQNGKHSIARNLINGFGFGTTEFHVIRPLGHILPEWIHSYVRQERILHEAEQAFTGAVGQQRVPKDFLINLFIPVPSIEEQKHITKKLYEQKPFMQSAVKTIEEELELINKLPASLLQQAFKGKL